MGEEEERRKEKKETIKRNCEVCRSVAYTPSLNGLVGTRMSGGGQNNGQVG